MLGVDIQPKVITQVASQIDMLPTMLSLIGVETQYPAIGRDLTRAECAQSEGRAMMQFGNNFAFMQDDQVVILQKKREP
ncbi:MAG: phosphoglycerol transferase MdoB-like AlkP superfamily enzyme [Paraglaciecola sp.]